MLQTAVTWIKAQLYIQVASDQFVKKQLMMTPVTDYEVAGILVGRKIKIYDSGLYIFC